MSDGQTRRHKRDFEPPPWETDAFERFKKEKDEREKEAELDQALAALKVGQEPTWEEPVVTPDPAEASTVEESTNEGETREEVIPAAELEELLAGLRQEEPRAVSQYRGVATIVMLLLGTGGVGLVVWSGILLGRAGPAAGVLHMTASLLVMVWGFMMLGFAVMLWRKHYL